MKIMDWLHDSMIHLRNAGVDSPRRDCLVLVEDLLNKDRAWVLANHEHELSRRQLNVLNRQIKRRLEREPLAYIRGRSWFYGSFFVVNTHTLIPRPESETFIDLLKEIAGKNNVIIDVGTGSGCLAITAKLELSQARVIAIDNDPKALKIAKQNAKSQGVKLDFYLYDLQRLFQSKTLLSQPGNTIMMANLPYVPNGLVTSPEITREPANALFSGEDGLDHYREFWTLMGKNKNLPKFVLCESLQSQHTSIMKLAQKTGLKLTKTAGLVQLFSR